MDPQTKKRVEILIQTVKKLEPEEIAMKIKHFDQGVCTEVFLSELKPVLPNPEQVGLALISSIGYSSLTGYYRLVS